jgi:uncharacterized protein (TIGR02145 family)
MKKTICILFTTVTAFMLLYGCKKEPEGSGTVKDLEGNSYGIIKIGNQVWMTENLRVGSYRDGSGILSRLYADYEWASAGPACAVYPNSQIDGLGSESEVAKAYGLLYNWAAVTDSRGLCPVGYHVPTKADWEELIDYLGGEDVAGGKLKSKRTDPVGHPRWDEPNDGATDGYYFHALPGGFRSFMGWFDYVGYSAEWWSSTELDDNFSGMMVIYSDESSATLTYRDKNCGLSVRCIQD